MANANTPFGFKPSSYLVGDTPHQLEIAVDSSNATSIGIGDPIILEADGNAARMGAGATLSAIIGVAVGFMSSEKISLNYLPTLTAGYVKYVPVVGRNFVIQASASVAATDVGALADVSTGNANATTGISAFQLDSATIGNAGTPLRILGLSGEPDNAYGTNAKVIVEFPTSMFTSGTGV